MIEEIVRKKFSRAFMGYDIEEVDQLLDAVCREFERAERESEILRLRIQLLSAQLEQAGIAGELPMEEAPAQLEAAEAQEES